MSPLSQKQREVLKWCQLMMNNNNFQKLLDKLGNAHEKYLKYLEEAENEYERRFGSNPSDLGDDFWIDNFHTCALDATVEQITREALDCIRIKGKTSTDS